MKKLKFLFYSATFISIVLVIVFFYRFKLMEYYAQYWELKIIPQTQVDAVYMLGGSPQTRLTAAAKFYSNYSNPLHPILISSLKLMNQDEKKFSNSESTLTMKLLKLKYRINNIHALSLNNRPLTSTYQEALACQEYFKSKNYKSLLLVTDAYHSKRAYITFKEVMGEGIDLYIFPTTNALFNPSTWWKSEKGITVYSMELIKFFNYKLNQKHSTLE